jgi:hypothetical protein
MIASERWREFNSVGLLTSWQVSPDAYLLNLDVLLMLNEEDVMKSIVNDLLLTYSIPLTSLKVITSHLQERACDFVPFRYKW